MTKTTPLFYSKHHFVKILAHLGVGHEIAVTHHPVSSGLRPLMTERLLTKVEAREAPLVAVVDDGRISRVSVKTVVIILEGGDGN